MNNRKYDAVIFDLDGTLVDTVRDIGEAVNYALEKSGKTPKNVDFHRERVGWGLRASLTKSVPGESEDFIDKVFLLVEDYYRNHPCVFTEPYKGIPEVLKKFKDVGLGLYVYTNKQEHIARLVVEQVFGRHLFDNVYGTVPDRPLKPHRDGIGWVVQQTGVEDSRILYVGDSEVDMETAREGQLDALAVLWGFRTREQMDEYPKLAYVAKPEEIEDFVLQQG